MIRSMFSAISGLRNHQTMMDVVGNNIANVNTTGFKSSSVVFQDVLSQTLRGAGAPTTVIGGTSPAQVGLGSKVGAITTSFAQGALQRTGRPTDIAIQGDGFFSVVQAGQALYTRSGAFSLDAKGNIVTQQGGFLQGWQADATGAINTNASVSNLAIPVGSLIPPVGTSTIRFGGNLPSDAPVSPAVGSAIVSSVDIYDTQGNVNTVTFTFTHTAANSWTATATRGNPAVAVALTDNVLTFDATGQLTAPADRNMNIAAGVIPNTGAISVDLGQATDANRATQYAGSNSISVLSQDGSATGSLQSFTVSQDGLIVGSYSNGRTRPIGQLALASFANPEGLERTGDSNYRTSVNSGLAQLGTAGVGGRGLLASGTLEMSNVDLAQEFTNLIVAQRGFQANSRVVTSSDELLQEIVNLKR